MDGNAKLVLLFLGFYFGWVLIPVIPAWLTYRITPDQTLGLDGPLRGLTLRTSGAFAAYLVVFLLSAEFVSRAGARIIGRATDVETWTVSGKLRAVDVDGKQTDPPDLEHLTVRMSPDPHRISAEEIGLRLPFAENARPVIYLDVPAWGGGRIVLSDPKFFDLDPLSREITLKDVVVLREKPRQGTALGAPALAGTHP